MTDDLVKRLLNAPADGLGTENLCLEAADRIEALTAERDRQYDENVHRIAMQAKAEADNARLRKSCECAMSEIRDYMQEVGGALPLELAMGWLSTALTGKEPSHE